jgi:hypothetical protein
LEGSTHFLLSEDHVIAQAARCWILTADTLVQSQVTSSDIVGKQSGNGAGFLNSLVFPQESSLRNAM